MFAILWLKSFWYKRRNFLFQILVHPDTNLYEQKIISWLHFLEFVQNYTCSVLSGDISNLKRGKKVLRRSSFCSPGTLKVEKTKIITFFSQTKIKNNFLLFFAFKFKNYLLSYWYVSSDYKKILRAHVSLKKEPVRSSRSCLVRTPILAIPGNGPKIRKINITFFWNIEKNWFLKARMIVCLPDWNPKTCHQPDRPLPPLKTYHQPIHRPQG